MQIEITPVDRLIPHIRNSRTHSAHQITQIATSIAAFSSPNPLLTGEDGVIIAGHGRLLAAKHLGRAEGPVIKLDHLSEAQRRALAIADNRISENPAGIPRKRATLFVALRVRPQSASWTLPAHRGATPISFGAPIPGVG